MEFKDFVPLIVAALGVLFGYLGAYFSALGKIRADKQERRHLLNTLIDNTRAVKNVEATLRQAEFLGRRELEYREQQLAELYGPVYAYLKSQRDIYEMWHKDKMLSAINLKVKQLFAQQNAIVRGLIVSKAHLVDAPGLPEYFVTFFTSTLLFDKFAAETEHGEVPLDVVNDPRSKFPGDFLEHIQQTTERLKRRIDRLHKQFAILPLNEEEPA
jgi:hypothetical protein